MLTAAECGQTAERKMAEAESDRVHGDAFRAILTKHIERAELLGTFSEHHKSTEP